MANYIFQIPTRTRTTNCIELFHSVYCFPSNYSEPTSNNIPVHKYNCLVIDASYGQRYKLILKNFITVLNLLKYEMRSVLWLSQLKSTKIQIVNKSVHEIKAEFLDENHDNASCDYERMYADLVIVSPAQISLIEVFKKYTNLSNKDFLYNALAFYSIISSVGQVAGNIYSNGLFTSSLQFQLFDALMNYYDEIKEVKNVCPTCNHESQRGYSKRIDDFFNSNYFEGITSKTDIKKAINKVAKNRHKFFHHLAGKSLVEYFNTYMNHPESPTNLNVRSDIKYAEGAIYSSMLIGCFNLIFMVSKLLEIPMKDIRLIEGVRGT